jgi:hypothetical protein
MTRMLATAVAVLVGLLAITTAANAASLTYIKDHDVWISNPDGSGAVRVTSNGTAEEPWNSPTMRDDGVIAAVKGFFVHIMRQNGEEIRNFVPGNLPGSTSGTHGLGFSPDGTKLVYAKVSLGSCIAADCDTRGISAVMDLEGNILGQEKEYTGGFPSWVTNDIVLSHGGYNYQNMLWRWHQDAFVNWFDDSDIAAPGKETDLGDGQVSDNHRSYVAIRGYGDNTAIATYYVNGDLSAPNPPLPTMLCFAIGAVSSPTVSGDGSTAYWHEPDGIWTFAVSPDCPNGEMLIPGASEPDWSAANVNPGPKTQPDQGKKAKCKKLKGKKRKRCLRRARG